MGNEPPILTAVERRVWDAWNALPDDEPRPVHAINSTGGNVAGMAGRPTTGTRVEVRIPDDVLAGVEHYASDDGVTRAEMIRELLAEAVALRDLMANGN